MMSKLYKDEESIDKAAKAKMTKNIDSIVRGIDRVVKKYKIAVDG